MRHLLSILAVLLLCSAPLHAQTLKSLMFNSANGQVVANTGTNVLTFTNDVKFGNGELTVSGQVISGTAVSFSFEDGAFAGPLYIMEGASIEFSSTTNAATTRTNLGLGATWLTNTNVTNFRTAIEAAKLHPNGSGVAEAAFGLWDYGAGLYAMQFNNGQVFFGGNSTISNFTTSLGLGATNIVTFAGLTNNGDITINQTATNNGLLYIRRTNSEPFLGLANLLASNNTTVSNETLFRVGVSEATNKAAQFGFRSTNTNGNGVAVFSVFGFNALMQIGADASTNAVIYSGGGTNNEVMTLIRDGATEFARPLRFSTNAASKPATNAPANTTNVAAWVEMLIGTNSYRVPLYQ